MAKGGGPPTMKDVAREAGVALGTVSKVFNQIPVGESYRLRVESAAARLGYQVNSYARGLKLNHTNSVALILPSLLHPFFSTLADSIIAGLMGRGYRTVLTITNYDPEAEDESIRLVRQNKVDGIIALTYSPDLKIDGGIPFVSIDRPVGDSPCISSDNLAGGRMAAEKLLELGCKRLLFLRIGSEIPGEADKRGLGFEAACRERGALFHSIRLNDSETEEPIYRFLEEHMRPGAVEFDGIFCNTDRLACHILQKLNDLGLSVPAEVQLIGFDGILNFATGRPYCSTLVQPVERMAELAVSVLLDQEQARLPALMCLPVHYEAGGTTRDSSFMCALQL